MISGNTTINKYAQSSSGCGRGFTADSWIEIHSCDKTSLKIACIGDLESAHTQRAAYACSTPCKLAGNAAAEAITQNGYCLESDMRVSVYVCLYACMCLFLSVNLRYRSQAKPRGSAPSRPDTRHIDALRLHSCTQKETGATGVPAGRTQSRAACMTNDYVRVCTEM